MRKIINDPDDFVDEVMAGIFAAYPDQVRPATPDNRTLVRSDAPVAGHVGIVTGGGSGHLPFFLGYVGQGLASGVAIGNVFSSPSAEQVYAASRAVDGGAGILYLYGNYGGDIYNFDLAADLCAADGISTRTVLGTDDIASAPAEKASTRRGVAGLIFAYKAAGAAAEKGMDLDEVTRIAQLAVDRTRTMGVGLSPTILPAAGEPTFTLDEGQMEIGIGIHGETGTHRGPLETADAITDRFLTAINGELDLTSGARVAVLVNGLGATPLEELFVIYRRVDQVLREQGVQIRQRFVGEYATSLEMAGASLSICLLDDELDELLAAPAGSPFFQHAAAGLRTTTPHRPAVTAGQDTPAGAAEVRRTGRLSTLRATLLQVLPTMAGYADELRALDAVLGDGDLGITVGTGSAAVVTRLGELPDDVHAETLLRAAGLTFASTNPSTFAALIGSGLLAAATAMQDVPDVDRDAAVRIGEVVFAAIQARGGAQLGDKTLLDALYPALDAARAADPEQAAVAAAAAAVAAVDNTAQWQSARGRAAWVGDRSTGHRDPGSVAVARFLQELAAGAAGSDG